MKKYKVVKPERLPEFGINHSINGIGDLYDGYVYKYSFSEPYIQIQYIPYESEYLYFNVCNVNNTKMSDCLIRFVNLITKLLEAGVIEEVEYDNI